MRRSDQSHSRIVSTDDEHTQKSFAGYAMRNGNSLSKEERVTIESNRSFVVAIIEAVAKASAASVEDLPPINNTIDADCLENLFKTTRDPDLQVQFTYCGYLVTVRTTEVYLQQEPHREL